MASSVTFTLSKTCYIEGKQDHGDEQQRSSSPKEAKYCELVCYHSLPDYLKDNEFVVNYYRANWPLKDTILSIFSIHNETINIWTHLIGFLFFLSLTIFAATMAAGSADRQAAHPAALNASFHHTTTHNFVYMNLSNWHTDYYSDMLVYQPKSHWPFFAFMFGAMFCLLTSTACHLLSCHSEQCAYATLRLDYIGISALIVTSFYPLVYYTFVCDPFFCGLYIGFITLFGAATILVSFVPVFRTPQFRTVRSLLFCCMAVSGLVPILHKLVVFGDRPGAIATTQYEVVMGVFYGLGVVVYATRVPERWMPGKFDLLGHSHQLFHVLVIAGAYTHYLGGLEYLKWREVDVC